MLHYLLHRRGLIFRLYLLHRDGKDNCLWGTILYVVLH